MNDGYEWDSLKNSKVECSKESQAVINITTSDL